MMTERTTIRFTLNGEPVAAQAAANENAIELLQRDFALSGARVSCAQGLCGCCTIAVDGVAASGCLLLAPLLNGCDVRTVESLADGDALDPIQRAFLDEAAFQCGFCTPGFIMMTRELLERIPHPTDDEIKHYLSGNLCRCAAYPEIVRAVRSAAAERAAVPER
jgi:aerobic-type carbon monoxide dehydrogenase small subunit (CoxS/CutS family)